MGLIWLILLLISPPNLAADTGYSVREYGFIPVRYYVGDVVDLRIRVTGSDTASLSSPSDMPAGSWLEIREITCVQVRKDEWEVRLRFATYKPGSHLLPTVDLGGMILPEIRTETRSILDDKGSDRIESLKDQMILTGTWLSLGLGVFLLIVLPFLVMLLYRFSGGMMKRYRTTRDRRLPRSRILRILRQLSRLLDKLDPRTFFIRISAAMRQYLVGRWDLPALTATTSELERLLPEKIPNPGLHRELVALFNRADLVKFGGAVSEDTEMRSIISRAGELVQRMEEIE